MQLAAESEGQEIMFRYWGKARPTSGEANGPQWHPLVYHSLDVAASGKMFLQQHHRLRRRWSQALGFQDDNVFLSWTTFFLALHDLGKFSEGFQALNLELFIALNGSRAQTRSYAIRHDTLGFVFWDQQLQHTLTEDNWLHLDADQRGMRRWRRALASWLKAVAGHHGKPPNVTEVIFNDHFSENDQHATLAFCRQARSLLLAEILDATPPLAQQFQEHSKHFSWWLAGIAVLADWVGSNQDFFPYHAPVFSLAEYWQMAQDHAICALQQSGVLPSAAALPQRFHQLFPKLRQPTPLQHTVAEQSLGTGPQLFILEDLTGTGKTEAALMLAHRLISAGLGDGVYIGLPTMATANAMFTRMEDVYARLYVQDAQPSLILAHSARDLSARFRQAVLPPVQALEQEYGPDEEQTASARCKAWLADNRKRALLAEVGVGTIDQALLAILYSKHQSLRLLGLFGKVLIVDEVHACDAYMLRLLRVLLHCHASVGGSAILLSATLPIDMRSTLAQAFCDGAGIEPPALDATAYPLLTHIGGSGEPEIALSTPAPVQRSVAVSWFTEFDDVLQAIIQAAQAGQCVCWIRNTVADARDAFTQLQGLIPPENLRLFHARFTLHDRLAIEHDILTSFDKHSTGNTRAGKVVIATQVIEQSLDLDFDFMISDLAPIDLLIQRAGRLCRHTRDLHGNVIDGPDQRGNPVLGIYGPKPIEEAPANWFAKVFPRAVKVYPDHGQLWLTAKLLREHSSFQMPDDARRLIEGVYSIDAECNMPPLLQEIHYQVEGELAAKRALGQLNSIALLTGYEANVSTWWDDSITPTRLGELTTLVRLARWNGETLKPWTEGRFDWQMSQIQVRQALITALPGTFEDVDLQVAIHQLLPQLPDQGKWSVLLPLTEKGDGLWHGQAVNGRGENVGVFYDTEYGLRLENEIEGQT